MLTARGWIQYLSDRAWLVGQGRVSARKAAEAMAGLNRHARGRGWLQDVIYNRKTLLVHALYRGGYATEVGLEKQKMPCWKCDGTGKHVHENPAYAMCRAKEGEKCPGCKCWNCTDGIFREHLLYRFAFDVHGLKVSWHQPRAIVTFGVVPTKPEVREYQAPDDGAELNRKQVRRSLLLVERFLRKRSVPVHSLATGDRYPQSWMKWRVLRTLRRTKRAMTTIMSRLVPGLPAKWDEDVPF